MCKKEERFLFLDIDGVINTIMIYDKPIENRRMICKDGFYFELNYPNDGRVSNEYAVRWLSKLCLEYNLKIVITSTWLIGHSLSEIKSCLYFSGLNKDIEIIDGCFTNQFKNRGIQIESWFLLKEIDPNKSIFVILDDDKDMQGFKYDFISYLIHCNTYTGFGIQEYQEACSKLDELIEERENEEKE